MQTVRLLINSKSLLVALLLMVSLPFSAWASELKKGESETNVYMELSFINDQSIAYTGSEATFRIHPKIEYQYALYDDVHIVTSAEYEPTVNENSIAYNDLVEKEFFLEDTFIRFSNPFGWGTYLRAGLVKVPFGHFNTFAFTHQQRPVASRRMREWDYGLRWDTSMKFMDVSLGFVNGEGREGTDANSAKSVVLRVAFTGGGSPDDIYPETLEVTTYPNPMVANPAGNFGLAVGFSAYAGNHYSTPIKEKNFHYAVDLKLDYAFFSLKAQASYLEGGFTSPNWMNDPEITPPDYGPAVDDVPNSFEEAMAIMAEISFGITRKLMITFMMESYDPDMNSDDTPERQSKDRIVFGVKYDYRPGVTLAYFYTYNDDPEHDALRPNDARVDDALQFGVAASF